MHERVNYERDGNWQIASHTNFSIWGLGLDYALVKKHALDDIQWKWNVWRI